jgi:gluconate 5-dehydrogenase
MTARFSLAGQVAIVTGASRGLGFEMAKGVAESGARVYMTARGVEQLEAAAATLRAGLDVRTRAFDLADPEACIAAVAEIGAAEGRLDILVNNAGINAWEPWQTPRRRPGTG